MKITNIKAYAFWLGFRNVCLVKVETDEGLYGWGESGLSGREKAVMGAIEHYKQFLIGKSAFNIGALWQDMYRSQYFEGGRVLSAAISAIDIALHDVCAKALRVPVHQLLGGKQRNHVPVFVTSILPYGQEMVDELVSFKEQGWTVMRATTGVHGTAGESSLFDPRASIAEAAHWLTKAREALGPEIVLGVDYHHRLSVPETISLCERMPPGTLDFIEEPIRAESPKVYEGLRQRVNVPLAIGEEFASKWDFAPYVDAGLTDFGRVDICNAGGLTESMKIAAMCETQYIDMMPHNPLSPICTAASIHYCAAIPNLAWLEWPPYDGDMSDYDRIFSARPQLVNNVLELPEGNGLGIDVNEDELQDLTFKFWETPRLHKNDGSFTNW
ncbi:mandelate racemase/muconate lactonizing enzyme family protein [Echinimonas agarilytica]|uniref:Mandelate racemase/muconate lactonizing enzyme family protein n=1 Tax=Echinimonas agarilytica TaxID=1215918 RepID=A0AA42B897_9GAMM|nr:mandelate racemase/muconate lactonizing enzyme family protein [Echinimonas agarilytica]MCM2680198.1 mandelate racemase/muconate lactonizing enzyme family protein [Echinimonas agarilytica]